ncbi:hypothetical protein MSAN_01824400 [Mycena sanguinolenta]|uniref:Ubiquitin-like protease family profile domain-containing protein n=1 Tax=Mycena sanguinolenta TaxID=230812 RepID=A0A8H6XUX7_9AGAR|nr:hypothetical protein MSAN_01824400 [Mycena sanguinolenta]
MSISQLLLTDLPCMSDDVDEMDLDFEFFAFTEPTKDIEDLLPYLAIPTRTMLVTMNSTLGQAWFDGKKSWHGHLTGFGDIEITRLTTLFSSQYLGTGIVDALAGLLAFRLHLSDDTISKNTIIVDTNFASFLEMLLPIVDGAATGPIRTSRGGQRYLQKYGAWSRDTEHRHLYLVLYRPPEHWTACSVDFQDRTIRYGDSLGWKRPKEFVDALQFWLRDNGHSNFTITDDLPCAKQTDGFNCPIIAVNTIAHNVFGDQLWTAQNAKAMRMEAFCAIVKHASVSGKGKQPASPEDQTDWAENLLAVNPDFNDAFVTPPVAPSKDVQATVAPQSNSENSGSSTQETSAPASESRGTKRRAQEIEDAMSRSETERKSKIAKTGKTEQPARSVHPFFASKSTLLADGGPSKSKPVKGTKTSNKKQKSTPQPQPVDPSIGLSKSATCARKLRMQAQSGEFQPSAAKTASFREKIREIDPDAGFEANSKEVQCSGCQQWRKMKEPYNTSRFSDHWKICKGAPPPAPLDDKARTIQEFSLVSNPAKPKKSIVPAKISMPCPGLTSAFDEKIGHYLARTGSHGGGGRAVAHYSEKLFKKEFQDLDEQQKELVYTAQRHDHTWRNDVTEGIMASFSVSCLKTVELFAKCKGLEGLFSEDNDFTLERRFAEHVVAGNFKKDTVFTGIIQAKVLAKDREIKGKGRQNFKHNEDLDAIFSLIYSISPRAYREIANHIPLRSERSIKQKISSAPRFPIGIQDETYGYAEQYCKDYRYPLGGPLSLSVDDTKLHAALRPLYNGPLGKWFIVGTTGEAIEVPNAEVLNDTLDRMEKTAELGKKLRLWVIQIPLPGVPPLALAIKAIGSKVNGATLAEWQISLMRGLITRGFRITSSGGDGASVERECQRLTAVASRVIECRIKHPDGPTYPDIIVALQELDGNVWVEIQDAKHGRKTFRNNALSGARGLVLGDAVVYFGQIYELAMKPDSPMYPRDVKETRDRMDDPAAARLFSADTLAQAAEDPEKNLGLVIYLLVFGDFIDAYQCRTLSHHERAKIAIRTHLFLQTWRTFLRKAGYPESRHFISKEAFSISEILVNGILGLILIHRDHLTTPTPLLPWFNASEPNEHVFAGLRDISKDFTFQEAILIVPKLRAKMQASVRTRIDPAVYKKQASGYCHTYFSSENINFGLLGQYPTDVELSLAYKIAAEENDCLWALLGIHPDQINAAPDPGIAPQPAPDPAFEHLYLNEDDLTVEEQITEPTAAEQVQKIIDNLHSTTGLSRAEDEELDACVMASVALSLDELARIEDLPDSHPEQYAEIQRDIALAMATQPTAFAALLQGMVNASLSKSADSLDHPPSSQPLIDVSSTDLEPLVALRREHQTEEERMGVRTYRASGTYTVPKTGVVKELTPRQKLAQAMGAIVKRDHQQGLSAGLNRQVRWKNDSTALPPPAKTGNAANAEVTAAGRAAENIRRRRTIFGKLKCSSTVAEAGIGINSVLKNGSYGFVQSGSDIVLARVVTMYTKGGGKAGPHAIAHRCENIGTLSYLFVQTYEHAFRRQFKNTRRADLALGTINRFAHLPSSSFLALLPVDENIKVFPNHIEIGFRGYSLFNTLIGEKEVLCKAVASLNTVRRKGQKNISLVDVPEDDGIAE